MVNAIRRTQHSKQIKCAVFWLILRLMVMVGLLQCIATIKRINRFRRGAQDTAAIDTAIVRVTTYQAKLDGKPIKPCQKPPFFFTGIKTQLAIGLIKSGKSRMGQQRTMANDFMKDIWLFDIIHVFKAANKVLYVKTFNF